MTEEVELKFPFEEGPGRARGAWPVEQEPTDLLILWPGDEEAPTQTEVVAALRDELGYGFAVIEEVDPPSPEVQWAMAARLGEYAAPAVIWTQPAMPVPPGELGDDAAEACRWVIGIETMLDANDPLTSFINLMKTLARAFSESPAIIDINSTMIHRREHLDAIYGTADDESVEPAADELWMIHVVHAPEASSESPDAGGNVWLHTHGLWRCGLPELEMLEVPANRASTAAELLNDIVSLMFEFPPPPPGERYEVGEGLAVTFQPWQDVVKSMEESVPGGPSDRREDVGENPHAGVRAVICGAEQRGSFRQVWTWPREVVERLENDEATIFMTQRATVRRAKVARDRWGDLAMAFATAQKASLVAVDDPSAVFLVKAGFAAEVGRAAAKDDHAPKEHLWFEVHHFNGDHADATLINQPMSVPAMNRGDRIRVDRDDVSDWQVQTVAGSFGPQDVHELWRAIDALKPHAGDPAPNESSETT